MKCTEMRLRKTTRLLQSYIHVHVYEHPWIDRWFYLYFSCCLLTCIQAFTTFSVKGAKSTFPSRVLNLNNTFNVPRNCLKPLPCQLSTTLTKIRSAPIRRWSNNASVDSPDTQYCKMPVKVLGLPAKCTNLCLQF